MGRVVTDPGRDSREGEARELGPGCEVSNWPRGELDWPWLGWYVYFGRAVPACQQGLSFETSFRGSDIASQLHFPQRKAIRKPRRAQKKRSNDLGKTVPISNPAKLTLPNVNARATVTGTHPSDGVPSG